MDQHNTIVFSNHFRSTVFNVIRMKSKNKFVKKNQIMLLLLSKFANGTFSWISLLGLTETEIGAETQTKCWIFFWGGGGAKISPQGGYSAQNTELGLTVTFCGYSGPWRPPECREGGGALPIVLLESVYSTNKITWPPPPHSLRGRRGPEIPQNTNQRFWGDFGLILEFVPPPPHGHGSIRTSIRKMY